MKHIRLFFVEQVLLSEELVKAAIFFLHVLVFDAMLLTYLQCFCATTRSIEHFLLGNGVIILAITVALIVPIRKNPDYRDKEFRELFCALCFGIAIGLASIIPLLIHPITP